MKTETGIILKGKLAENVYSQNSRNGYKLVLREIRIDRAIKREIVINNIDSCDFNYDYRFLLFNNGELADVGGMW